jgi:hypothetical protein
MKREREATLRYSPYAESHDSRVEQAARQQDAEPVRLWSWLELRLTKAAAVRTARAAHARIS